MAKWAPAADVEANEPVGRRMFDEPLLVGTAGQPSFAGLLVTHFEEERDDEISVDRLGRTGIDKRVVAFLKPRADLAGGKFRKPKTFNGWVVLSARELRKDRANRRGLQIVASPISDPTPNDNPYHAHIRRPSDLDSTMTALYLRHLFTTYGKVEPVSSAEAKRSWWGRLVERIMVEFAQFKSRFTKSRNQP
jgi:hypothetical protein